MVSWSSWEITILSNVTPASAAQASMALFSASSAPGSSGFNTFMVLPSVFTEPSAWVSAGAGAPEFELPPQAARDRAIIAARTPAAAILLVFFIITFLSFLLSYHFID